MLLVIGHLDGVLVEIARLLVYQILLNQVVEAVVVAGTRLYLQRYLKLAQLLRMIQELVKWGVARLAGVIRAVLLRDGVL